jgi:PIN domain nuclease of toxin-antitoxin system
MNTVVLDTHVMFWWSSEPDRLSSIATNAVRGADELAVAAISWYELAWLARNDRIIIRIPIRSWLEQLARRVRTISVTPGIAETAVSLPASFPKDPADRLIYATAVENGCPLVTKDQKLLEHPYPQPLALW